jgi:hypothetical protein
LWIERDGRRLDVISIEAQWREEERLGFRVRLSDGASWLLYYVPELDLWSGIADAAVGGGASAARRRDGPSDGPAPS